jgi:integrase/recombinase XerD
MPPLPPRNSRPCPNVHRFVTTLDNDPYRESLVPVTGATVALSHSIERHVAGWLLGFASAHTRAAYGRDVRRWLSFCSEHDAEPLKARRGHVDAWARLLEAEGASPATVARRLAAVSSWYSWLVGEGIVAASPLAHVRRPKVSDDSTTLGPDRDEARALLNAATALGPKCEAVISLLLLNGLRVGEVVRADVEDLSTERGHRVLRITRKGGRAAVVPLAPRTAAALDAYLDDREGGPLFFGEQRGRGEVGCITASGITYIVERVAKLAGIKNHFSPHSLRHGFVTLALEAGVTLTDVQDAAGHADPRTTRRYDRARHRLDAAPTYALAAALAE